MKKYFLFGFLLAIVSIMATGCSSCQSENNKQDNAPAQEQVTNFNADYDGVVPDLTEGAEHVIALQRQTMFNAVNGGTEDRDARLRAADGDYFNLPDV